ncbi:MAG: lipase, partial [Bacteroidota bacterium]
VGIVEHLRGRGINAHAPYVVPYATIAERAGMWKTHLDEIVANSASDHAHLIGFSMGGLDARYLISVLGAHQNVATLTTVATPHHGSPLASFVLSRPALLKNLIVGSMNRVGTYAFTEAASNAEAALHELTPEYLDETFNPAVPDHESVTYYSYAARAGRGTGIRLNPTMFISNWVAYAKAGINDGFVPIESAKWAGYQGIIDADHGELIGLSYPGSTFDTHAFYARVAHLIGVEPEPAL